MGIFDRLFGKKKDSEKKDLMSTLGVVEKKTIKKTNKKTIKKSAPTENYEIILVELKSRGGNVSKSELKRFCNKTVFETFMSVNSHHFNTPTLTWFGADEYLSKGGCIKLSYTNRHNNGTPPFTIAISIKKNGGSWRSFGPRNYITGNFLVSPTDEKLFTEIKKIKSIHSRVSKITPDTYNKMIEEEKKRLEETQEKIISKLDKAGTGIVDEIENNDEFKKLLNKYEKEIAEIDRKHIKDFVKLSSYLKTKEKNIQLIFNSIKGTANKKEFKEYVGILKNEIHWYKLYYYNALNMIVALVEDKHIIFYEIYESFDKLDVFNSNWENEISGKLSNIGDGLNDLMYSIHEMGADIVAEIGNLSYVTEESSSMLEQKLEEVDSSVKTNNLLSTIQSYQLYKLNKSNRNRLNK